MLRILVGHKGTIEDDLPTLMGNADTNIYKLM